MVHDRPMTMRTPVVGVAMLLALAGCGGEPAPRPRAALTPGPSGSPAVESSAVESSAVGSPVGGCTDSAGQVDAPPEDYRTVAGVVAVPTGRTLEVAASGVSSFKLFAKWGLLVRTGQTVEVTVGGGWAGRAGVGWGGGVGPAASVRVTACPDGSPPHPWTAFAGGTWLDRPACVPLTIRAGGRSALARMPVGTSCR